MTCAEARRRLPAPESGAGDAALLEHLSGCAPCQGEADALLEVDRRVQNLGAYRRLSVAEQVLQLDRRLVSAQPVRSKPEGPARRIAPALLALIALLSISVLALAFALARRP